MNRFGLSLKRTCCVTSLSALVGIVAALPLHAAVVFSNGFETDTAGWTSATRVASGNNGITSASGNFHAEVAPGTGPNHGSSSTYTYWGNSNYGAGNVPTAFQEYWTSVDVFLNVNGGFANDTRFDWDSAISKSDGTFNRDFVFNAGFYNDASGPGASTNRFVISASNNSQRGSAFAKNPARAPIAISTTGWYTFEQHFYDNSGVLAVDLNIFDSLNSLVNSWTLSNPSDLIGGIGGNQYGWFDLNESSVLAFDNTELRTATAAVPEPLSVAVWSCVAVTLGGLTWWQRRNAKSSAV